MSKTVPADAIRFTFEDPSAYLMPGYIVTVHTEDMDRAMAFGGFDLTQDDRGEVIVGQPFIEAIGGVDENADRIEIPVADILWIEVH